MTNKKLMKKIAPVVMSAAVAMTSMPYAVLASDFTDSEVITDSTDFSVSEEFAAEDAQEEFTPKMSRMLLLLKHGRVKLMCL